MLGRNAMEKTPSLILEPILPALRPNKNSTTSRQSLSLSLLMVYSPLLIGIRVFQQHCWLPGHFHTTFFALLLACHLVVNIITPSCLFRGAGIGSRRYCIMMGLGAIHGQLLVRRLEGSVMM